jgi:hypothetical protein
MRERSAASPPRSAAPSLPRPCAALTADPPPPLLHIPTDAAIAPSFGRSTGELGARGADTRAGWREVATPASPTPSPRPSTPPRPASARSCLKTRSRLMKSVDGFVMLAVVTARVCGLADGRGARAASVPRRRDAVPAERCSMVLCESPELPPQTAESRAAREAKSTRLLGPRSRKKTQRCARLVYLAVRFFRPPTIHYM